MASNAPGQCCTVGVKHEGQAVGELKNIGETSTYFSYTKDKSTENAVLILTDVIGHKMINAQLIADQFAANGYFTVMPDLFHGEPMALNRPPDFDLGKWLQGHQPSRVDPVVTEVINEMRTKHGVKKLAAVGYCFGAKYVVRYMGQHGREQNAKVDCGYVAHPSLVEADELKAMEGPLSIAAAETDGIFPEEKRHESEQILKEMSLSAKKLPYQINLFSGVEHGFAVRGDPKDKRIKFAKEQAFIQAVQWFDEFLKGNN